MKKLLLSVLFITTAFSFSHAQDMFRLGFGASLKDSTNFIQTFSFDFNRTESVKEKAGKALLFNAKGLYLTPSSDVNLGEGTTASENNVTFQMALGKVFYGELKNQNLKQRQLNTGLELSPSYTADKSFEEYLYYLQASYKLNWLGSTFSGSDPKDYVKRGFLLALSPFVNAGNRSSKNLDQDELYCIGGILLELKYRSLIQNKKKELVENWVFKLSGDYFGIIAEMEEIYNKDFAGKLKCSIDKRLFEQLALNLSYKLGNDGPIYKDFHALEMGIKVKY
jgi:hypothetical protein